MEKHITRTLWKRELPDDAHLDNKAWIFIMERNQEFNDTHAWVIIVDTHEIARF